MDMLDLQNITNQDDLINTLATIAKAKQRCHVYICIYLVPHCWDETQNGNSHHLVRHFTIFKNLVWFWTQEFSFYNTILVRTHALIHRLQQHQQFTQTH